MLDCRSCGYMYFRTICGVEHWRGFDNYKARTVPRTESKSHYHHHHHPLPQTRAHSSLHHHHLFTMRSISSLLTALALAPLSAMAAREVFAHYMVSLYIYIYPNDIHTHTCPSLLVRKLTGAAGRHQWTKHRRLEQRHHTREGGEDRWFRDQRGAERRLESHAAQPGVPVGRVERQLQVVHLVRYGESRDVSNGQRLQLTRLSSSAVECGLSRRLRSSSTPIKTARPSLRSTTSLSCLLSRARTSLASGPRLSRALARCSLFLLGHPWGPERSSRTWVWLTEPVSSPHIHIHIYNPDTQANAGNPPVPWDAWPHNRSPAHKTTESDRAWISAVPGKAFMMPVSPWFYTNLPQFGKNWNWDSDTLWFDRWEQVLDILPQYVEVSSWE